MNSFSQKGYKVTYTREEEYVWPFTVNQEEHKENSVLWYNLIFNDSISFSFISKTRNQNWKKYCKPGASKVLHHSTFFKRFSNELFDGVAYPDPQHPFFIHNTPSAGPVHIDSTIKRYKEWRCREGYTILNTGDTLFALLAIDYPYPYPYGPLNYIHFPFLPVEIYYPRIDLHLQAKKIEEGDFAIFIPSGIAVITRNEFNKIKKVQD